VRVAALNGLGHIDPALPAESALTALGDEEPLVRLAAALNIGASTDPAAVDVLIETLSRDSDPAVREAAADALGQIGDPRAKDALRRADSLWRVVFSWRVVRAARRALRRIEDGTQAVPRSWKPATPNQADPLVQRTRVVARLLGRRP
jgi:HEAT repeat protein